MVDLLRPARGGFLRRVSLGLFVRDFLLGVGPEGSPKIDPKRGSTQSDICFQYKLAAARALARENAEKIISSMVLCGTDVTEEQAEEIYQNELKKIPLKTSFMRFHSFLMYFGIPKRLKWVEFTGESEPSAMQENFPQAPARKYYRITTNGKEASEKQWSNPLFTLYPNVGSNHHKINN